MSLSGLLRAYWKASFVKFVTFPPASKIKEVENDPLDIYENESLKIDILHIEPLRDYNVNVYNL